MKCRFLEAAWEEDACRGTRMHSYPRAAVERMMNVQEVILRAMAKKITWWQAAEIIGMSDRQMRRLHWRYREHGYDGLLDRRVGQPVPSACRWRWSSRCSGCTRRSISIMNVSIFTRAA